MTYISFNEIEFLTKSHNKNDDFGVIRTLTFCILGNIAYL